eukprot:scaffold306824_cov19-Tisochrysis_lutea.AAC.1
MFLSGKGWWGAPEGTGGTRTALHAPPATAAHASKALETCKVHLSPCMFRRQVEGACSHAGCGEGRLH